MVIPGNPTYNNNKNASDLENNIKEFINTQKAFNASIEEKLNKIDDLSRSVDKITHDVETLKMKIFVPKVEESIKALYVSMDESKKRTAMLCHAQYATQSKRNSKVPQRIDPHIETLLQGGYHYINIT